MYTSLYLFRWRSEILSVDNGQKALQTLFAENILRVPQFQRAYAWTSEPHLRNFVEDLRSYPADNDQRYFLGTILLTRNRVLESSKFGGYDVVDGQQRLTTTTIFVSAAIRILATDSQFDDLANEYQGIVLKKHRVRKFLTIAEDDAFFDRFIVGPELGTESNCSTPSQKRLLAAMQYFTTYLTDLSSSEIDALVTRLLRSEILVYAVNSNAEATQIFELQNDRGKRLTDLEALKSFLMHGLYLHSGDGTETDLSHIQSNFAAIYRALEKLEGKFAAPDEDQLLSYHCTAFEKWVRLEDRADGWEKPKQLVQHLLGQVAEHAKTDWIKELSNRLRDSYESALQILETRDNDLCVPLGDLAAMGRTATFWPLLLKCWKFDAAGASFSDAASEMARFTFRASIASKRADTGEPVLRQRARDFQGDFHALISYLTEMRVGWDIPNAYTLGLNTENFFDWQRLATYMLWRYENYLRTQPGCQSPRLSWKTIVTPVSTAVKYAKDHIEAKDPANPKLMRQVKWNPKDENTRPFSEAYLNRLGNLVLDTVSTGSAKGNKEFVSRMGHYVKSTFLSQGEIVSLFASKDSTGNLNWDEAAIQKRHQALVAFAEEHM
jgi:hypothetical protein